MMSIGIPKAEADIWAPRDAERRRKLREAYWIAYNKWMANEGGYWGSYGQSQAFLDALVQVGLVAEVKQ